MELLVIGIAALFAAALTFFSGFGVGTLMTPVFALFFPLPLAIAATAVVHVVNNLFKLGLTVRNASWRVVAAFGLPAMLAARDSSTARCGGRYWWGRCAPARARCSVGSC